MFGRLATALRGLLQRNRVAREVDEELSFHIDMETRANEANGLSPAEARRAALRDLGGIESIKAAIRDVRTTWLDVLRQDVRFARRTVSRHPAPAFASVAMLAVGIGVTTATFTVADALIFRPLPFAAPEDLAFVYMGNDSGGRTNVAPAVLSAWQASAAFAGAESAVSVTALVGTGDALIAREQARVTPGVFALLGNVRPIRGRLFDSSDVRSGIDDLVVISESLWRTTFQATSEIVGHPIVVDGERLTVVGVLPASFRFPQSSTAIWRAVNPESMPASAADERPRAYVRFAPSLPRHDAIRLAEEAARAADSTNAELRLNVEPLAGDVVDPADARALPYFAAAVILVFLVLCANVCSLILVRMAARQRELRVQAVLGASRGRLIRQTLVEASILSAGGAVASVAVAGALVAGARAYLPEAFLLRTLNTLDIDARALAVTSLTAVATVFAAGLLPAWVGTRPRARDTAWLSDRGATESPVTRMAIRTLIAIELGVACTLLVSGAMLVRSFVNLATAERGLDIDRVIVSTLVLEAPAFPDQTARLAATRAVEERVRQLPGVTQVAWTYGLPPRRVSFSFGSWWSDASESAVVDMRVDRYRVGPEFFRLYGIPLLQGRLFHAHDRPGAVVIGERLARALWHGQDPIGRTFGLEDNQQFHVVGVAREIHYPQLDTSLDRPEFYEPLVDIPANAMISLRCATGCPDEAVIRQAMTSAHPALHVREVQALARAYLEPLARPRATAALASAFAFVALLAATGGLYSLLSYAVGRRRREFGIRAALGASPIRIQRLVLRDGAGVCAAGIAAGTLATWLLGRVLESLQYGVTLADPLIWAVVLAAIVATALAASWRPVRHAMRVDPAQLLREE